MIISGYPGVGKTTASKHFYDLVDIESKYFRSRDDGDGWIGGEEGLRRYIWLIRDLNNAGKVVLVSSHKEVRQRLIDDDGIDNEDLIFVCPRVEDESEWQAHLYQRWVDSTEMKDWHAYKRAIKYFKADIEDIMLDKDKGINVVTIKKDDLKEGLMLYLVKNRYVDYVNGMEEIINDRY